MLTNRFPIYPPMGKLNLRPLYKTSGFRARIDSHFPKRIEWESIFAVGNYRKSFVSNELHQHLRDSCPK
ncbi:hypothetical protein Pan181_01850 [Aeoliella mucimassa]|uniref:Uncharacterized protein n=1 Tax=Aeoliella mucimassa TaxID=2527972 RepID=A0A518AH01_9BACT|nr:hypothetical protein Pan181_01850 [Aeoliella mucimassa]